MVMGFCRGLGRRVMAVGLVVALSACSSTNGAEEAATPTDHFTYVANSLLTTTNAGSNEGSATNAQVLAGQLYPGTYVLGPKGQLIPNTDLVQATLLPATESQVVYRIQQDVTYSDGQPLTCDSFLMAFTAAKHAQLFGSHLPLLDQVSRVDCMPGSKQATLVLKRGYGDRWRQYFGPGVLLPAHAVAARAGMSLEELNTLLKSEDEEALAPIAEIWAHAFNLAEFDPAMQVSYGPFVISEVDPSGRVLLTRNENYHGVQAALSHVELWPRTADLASLRETGDLRVVDTSNGKDLAWLNRDDPESPFDVELIAGILTEQLVLGSAGVFYDQEARRQFAACVDQQAVADVSKEQSGVAVEPVYARTLRTDDSREAQMEDILAPHRESNLDFARQLEGTTIRIGYRGPDERKAAMVEAIRKSCEPAGINVVDVSGEASTFGDLATTYVSEWGYETYQDGSADAILQAIDPVSEFPEIATTSANLEQARRAEVESWEQMRTIPLASQPRVYVTHRMVSNVVSNTDLSGIGWNMQRWRED